MTQKFSRMLSDAKTILGIAIVLIGLVGWALGLTMRVDRHDVDIKTLQLDTQELRSDYTDRAARMETKIDFLVERERARKD